MKRREVKIREFKIRPDDDFIRTAKWEEIYSLTEHWLAELDYLKDEITFLEILVGKYFIWMTRKEHLLTIHKIAADIRNLNAKQKDLNEKTQKHLKDLGLLMENAFSTSQEWFRDEHVKLEEHLTELNKQFREAKKEVFGIIEHIIESRKLQHLLEV